MTQEMEELKEQGKELGFEQDRTTKKGEDEATPTYVVEGESEDLGAEEATDADAEAKRERRKKERQERATHRREVIDEKRQLIQMLHNQNEALTARIQQLEAKTSGDSLQHIEDGIRGAHAQYQDARSRYLIAVKSNDAAAQLEAQEMMTEARTAFDALHQKRNTFIEKPAHTEVQQRRPEPLDPKTALLSQAWMQKNADWYDPLCRDVISQEAAKVDAEVRADGFDPTTPDYWAELDDRLVEKGVKGTRTTKPAITGGSGRESRGGSGTFTLSKARKDAMVEAGLWDDPKLRARTIKRYQEHDKAQGEKNV